MRNVAAALFIALVSTAAAVNAGTISISTPACTAVFETTPSGERIAAADYSTSVSPGDPQLPFKELHVVLPPDADPSSVSVTLSGADKSLLPGQHNICPAPPIVTVVDGKEIHDWANAQPDESGRNLAVYSRNEFYPRANVTLIDVGGMRTYRIARLRYYPYRYNPVSRQLEYSTNGQITVTYASMQRVTSAGEAHPSAMFAAKLMNWAANPAQARQWYAQPASLTTSAQESAQTTNNYVIITTSAIAIASTKLQAFVNHRASRGFTVGLVAQSEWGGGTGDAAANNIRAFLKSNYLARGIEYVLLIGDPNPSSGAVPMKMLWPRHSSGSYMEAPSDYFYADLTGNWDRDGDGYFGEGDHDFGRGGIDVYPEVIVGRIPVYGSNCADLDSILQKIMDYESGGIGGDWVQNVLLSMKPSDGNTPGYQLGEAIKSSTASYGYTATRVYETNYGLNPPPEHTPCTYDTVLNAWQQRAGFHFWWTHGNETIAADIMSSDRTAYLDDRYPSFVFQCSCLNGAPEYSNNLGYSLLKRGAIATTSASRVSWYYAGQTSFTNTDSNAGMTYKYATKLLCDRLPCGDAHYEMMVEVPNTIWMNHCVFNLYGDPAVSLAQGPHIQHTPLADTDSTSAPYAVEAAVTYRAPLKAGTPALKWNLNGGSTFNTVQMSLTTGSTYRAQIPAQPNGTTVYYYIYVQDTQNQIAVSPSGGPYTLHSFHVRPDSQPPTILHTPLADTGNTAGPYAVRATITDDTSVSSAALYYHRNSGADSSVAMAPVGDNVYEASIPGPSSPGDLISYYITATDISIGGNTARSPASAGYYQFSIPRPVSVGVFNCSSVPSYFRGSNSNIYSQVADALNADEAQRFKVTILTDLSPADIADKDALVFPDNAPLVDDLQSVADWFGPGKIIMTLESGSSYAGQSGFLWPQYTNTNCYLKAWDGNSYPGDQEVILSDPITAGYTLGQVIDAGSYEAQFFTSALPAEARVLTRSKTDTTRAYAVYRDVPGRGRIVALGPYVPVTENHHSIIRQALVLPGTARTITVTAPSAGAVFEAGAPVTISFQTAGGWTATDTVKLEYTTGLDSVWRAAPGADALAHSAALFTWNTSGLPGSHGYKVRASMVGGSVSDESDGPFTIVPCVRIPDAKSIAEGSFVKLSGKVVTCNSNGITYVQEPGRYSGIRVASAGTLSAQSLASIVGTICTLSGERAINAESCTVISSAAQMAPVLLNTTALGGGQFGGQQAVMEYRMVREGKTFVRTLLPAAGLNNIGLLVRVVGKVTAVGADSFYIDDGGACDDDSGYRGVKVLCGCLQAPALDSRVTLTAVSSTYYDRGNLWRALVLPGQSSLQVIE